MQADRPFLTANQIFSLVDLTDLTATCTEESIRTLCQKAIQPDAHAAAVCVWPAFVSTAIQHLKNTDVKVATVVNFPEGNHPLKTVLTDIKSALRNGASEIDLVFPRDRFFAGDTVFVKSFLATCRQACGNKILKIILETGAFSDQEALSKACLLCCDAGADFLKTSTGKIHRGATLSTAKILLHAISKHAPQTGIKISGGIRTINQLQPYLTLACRIMGNTWVTPTHFRVGASQLNATASVE